MASAKKRRIRDSLLGCMDQANLAVVHRLSLTLLEHSDALPSLRTLQSMSSSVLDVIGTEIDVPLEAGGTMKIKVVRPQEAIPYLIAHVPAFRNLFDIRIKLFPCTLGKPWMMLYHEDEITPGAVLRPDSQRKFHILYATFKELGVTSATNGWIDLALIRSHLAHQFCGAFSG